MINNFARSCKNTSFCSLWGSVEWGICRLKKGLWMWGGHWTRCEPEQLWLHWFPFLLKSLMKLTSDFKQMCAVIWTQSVMAVEDRLITDCSTSSLCLLSDQEPPQWHSDQWWWWSPSARCCEVKPCPINKDELMGLKCCFKFKYSLQM